MYVYECTHVYSCPWYKTNFYLCNCMFACTIVLPYPKVLIKISRWDLSKSNVIKRSSKYSPIWKIYLGRLKKKFLITNKSCWNHSKNIKSGLRITWQSLQHCTHSNSDLEKKCFNKWHSSSRETTHSTTVRKII